MNRCKWLKTEFTNFLGYVSNVNQDKRISINSKQDKTITFSWVWLSLPNTPRNWTISFSLSHNFNLICIFILTVVLLWNHLRNLINDKKRCYLLTVTLTWILIFIFSTLNLDDSTSLDTRIHNTSIIVQIENSYKFYINNALPTPSPGSPTVISSQEMSLW